MIPSKCGAFKLSLTTVGAAMCLFAGACLAQSAEPATSNFRVSGFGTLGFAHSSAPEGWGFLRSIDQPSSTHNSRADIDSRFGVQVNYTATSQIELVGQVMAARRESSAPIGDTVEWAFAAYRPTADLTFRVGRLNLDQFVMSDYRNVGFAYLYARPPVEYYGSIPTNLDGVDVARTWTFDEVQWRAKGFVGRSKINAIPLKNVFGASIAREEGGLLLRAGWTHAKFARNTEGTSRLIESLNQVRALPVPSVSADASAMVSNLDLAAKPLTYATFGLTYMQSEWQYAAEVTRVSLGNSKVNAGYASVARHFGDVSLFGIVSGASGNTSVVPNPVWQPVLAPLIGPAAARQAQMLGTLAAPYASRTTRQTTYSLGARWNLHPRMALKVQWDHVKVRPNGGFLWSNSKNDPGSANTGTVLLDFVF